MDTTNQPIKVNANQNCIVRFLFWLFGKKPLPPGTLDDREMQQEIMRSISILGPSECLEIHENLESRGKHYKLTGFGVIYLLLYRLEQKGCVEATWHTCEHGGYLKTTYELTELGARLLQQ